MTALDAVSQTCLKAVHKFEFVAKELYTVRAAIEVDGCVEIVCVQQIRTTVSTFVVAACRLGSPFPRRREAAARRVAGRPRKDDNGGCPLFERLG